MLNNKRILEEGRKGVRDFGKVSRMKEGPKVLDGKDYREETYDKTQGTLKEKLCL